MGVSNTYCVVSFVLLDFVLCMDVSNTHCVVFIYFVCLRLVSFVPKVSLDCPFLIAPFGFSNVYLFKDMKDK